MDIAHQQQPATQVDRVVFLDFIK